MSIDELEDIDRLKKINRALMMRVESAMDQQGNAFSLFQTAISLEGQVRRRTDELTVALRGLEKTNSELALAKEASENANLSKTRFLAAASHDVLQPLNAALLSISVLEDLQESETGIRLTQQIERSLDTMNDLLKTLINISKLDAGVVQPRIEVLAVQPALAELKSNFLPVANEKGLELRFRCGDHFVKTDRTMFQRILQNLISNGLRYTSKGGILVAGRVRNDQLWLDVTDTGCGISSEHHDQIFEEFHRGPLPSGHKREANSGLGLGLSIVKRMVRALGHDLDLTSRPERGSRFRLRIPLAKNVKHQSSANEAPEVKFSTHLKGAKILLIENDPASIEAASLLLQQWGCQTAIAGSMSEAVNALGDTNWLPDLIIADQHLDHGDLGTIVAEEARAYLNRLVPVLIITADPTKDLEHQVRELKMEMMQKPIKPAQLRALLSHMLARSTGNIETTV